MALALRARRSDKIKDIYATPRIERGTQVMTDEDTFQKQIAELEERFGPKTKLRTYQVLTEVVRWLHESGHGNITLSAVDHLLGQKIRAETIITTDGQVK